MMNSLFGFGRSAGPVEVASIADASLATADPSALLSAAGGDAGDVAWAPLPAQEAAKPKQPLPYKLKQHDVKARLSDRSTAVVNMRAVAVDAPHDVMFDLLADPHQHEHIFDAIESARAQLVSEEGAVRTWRLDYRARWKFWKVGGVCDNRLWMTTDRDKGTVSFVLREPGFLRKYEGTWTITGPDGKGPGARAPSSSSHTHPSTPSTTASAPGAAAPPSTPAPPFAGLQLPQLPLPSLHAISAAVKAALPAPGTPRSPLDQATAPASPAAGRSSGAASHAGFSSVSMARSHSSSSLASQSMGGSTPPDTPRSNGSSSGGGGGGNEASSSSSPSVGKGRGGFARFLSHVANPFTFTPSGATAFGVPAADAAAPPAARRGSSERPAPPAAAAAASPRAHPLASISMGSDFGAPAADAHHHQPAAAAGPRSTTIMVVKSMSPKISPPFPINQVLKGHAAGQVAEMLEGLLVATARKVEEAEAEGRSGGVRAAGRKLLGK